MRAKRGKAKYYLPKEHVSLGWIVLGMGTLALGALLLLESYLVSLIDKVVPPLPLFSAIGGVIFLLAGILLIEHGFDERWIERQYLYEESG